MSVTHFATTILRNITLLLIGSIISIALFIWIQATLTFHNTTMINQPNVQQIDFVRLIHAPTPNLSQSQSAPSELPQLPIKSVPPKLPALVLPQPHLQPMQPPTVELSQFKPKLTLNESLFPGDYQKPPPSPAPEVVFQTDNEIIALLKIPPNYPKRAIRLGIEGEVNLELHINAEGHVQRATIINAKPPNLFNSAALRSIKQWRFKPKIVNGNAVPRKASQTIEFRLQ
jgi:periplasmic protein TonB